MEQFFGIIYNLLLVFKWSIERFVDLFILKGQERKDILSSLFPNWFVTLLTIIIFCGILLKAYKHFWFLGKK